MSQDNNIITNLNVFRGTTVRRKLINGEIWFVAKDVCDVLGIKNSRDAIKNLDEDEKGDVVLTDTSSHRQNYKIISESGLYYLLNKSRKPIANEFRRWIRKDVVPSIRKTGTYTLHPAERFKDKRLNWELDQYIATYLKWNYGDDAITCARVKDWLETKWLNAGPRKALPDDNSYLFDLSEILIQMNVKPKDVNLVSVGRYVAKRYREEFQKEPLTSLKACNGAYRSCKVYKPSETVSVKQWINDYRNKQASNNSSSSNSINKVIDDVLIDMNDNKN